MPELSASVDDSSTLEETSILEDELVVVVGARSPVVEMPASLIVLWGSWVPGLLPRDSIDEGGLSSSPYSSSCWGNGLAG